MRLKLIPAYARRFGRQAFRGRWLFVLKGLFVGYRELLSSFSSSAGQYPPAVGCSHALPKTVLILSLFA